MVQVVLESGTALAAGCVVCGIGVDPATDFLQSSAVQLDDAGYVVVDQVHGMRRSRPCTWDVVIQIYSTIVMLPSVTDVFIAKYALKCAQWGAKLN